MIKRVSALILALTISLTAMGGCAGKKDKKDSSSSSSSESSAEKDDSAAPDDSGSSQPEAEATGFYADDYVVCTIGGIDVTYPEFRYYFYSTLYIYYTNYSIDLDYFMENDNAFQQFKEDVIMSMKQDLVYIKLANDNGITLDEADMQKIEESIQRSKEMYPDPVEYENELRTSYLTEDLYRTMLERAELYTKVINTLFRNDGKYATKKEDFLALVESGDAYAHELHIMIPAFSTIELPADENSGEDFDSLSLSAKSMKLQLAFADLDEEAQKKADEDAKALADEVCKMAADGEDFEKLITEFGWDAKLEDPSIGFYIDRNNNAGFPDTVVEAVFSLDPGEITSEPIYDPEYGYFIVKRLDIDMDYVNDNLDEMIFLYDTENMNDVIRDELTNMKVTYCDEWSTLTPDAVY
ncbi:MAG: peptidylprolyl isomerase [Ruminococcus sp.]|nr:peptidylprolyl isomerase [Ruminococcus sp.]